MRRTHLLLIVLGLLTGFSACSSDKKSSNSDQDATTGNLDGGAMADANGSSNNNAGQNAGQNGGDAQVNNGDAQASNGNNAEGGVEGDGGTWDVATLCAKLRAATCDYNDRCRGGDCDSWLLVSQIGSGCATATTFEEAGELSVNMEQAALCLDEIEGHSCESQPAFFTQCRRLFDGVRPDGADCLGTADVFMAVSHCEGYCQGTADQCPGTCAPYRTGGQTCGGGSTDMRCGPNLGCVGICVTPQGEGEPCERDAGCEPGLFCLGNPRHCVLKRGEGADCMEDYDCKSPFLCVDDVCTLKVGSGDACDSDENCPEGDSCLPVDENEDSHTCRPRITEGNDCNEAISECETDLTCSGEPPKCVQPYAGLNEPCGPWGCDPELDLWCKLSSSTDGTCVPKVAEGLDCSDYNGSGGLHRCQDGLICMWDDLCHPPGDVDEPCRWDEGTSCIESLFCDRETSLCKAPRTEGQQCNPMTVFALRACVDGQYCQCLSAQCPGISSSQQPEDVCGPLKMNGADCDWDYECLSGYCDDDDLCADYPQACIPAFYPYPPLE